MAKEQQAAPRPSFAVAVEPMPGELFQLVLHKFEGGKHVGTERPYKPHVWGHVKFELEQQLLERIYPPGLE